MSASSVVRRPVDCEHRAECNRRVDPVSSGGESTASHEGRDVAEDARLLGPPAGGMPRLGRNDGVRVRCQLGADTIEKVGGGPDVGVEK